MLKRIVCLMAAIALTVASAVPALAVTPQEGWFISGTMERNGINYYIIDNKVNDQKWWVDLTGGFLRFDETFESGYTDADGNMWGISYGVNGVMYAQEAWYGFCPDDDFRLDNDWLIEVSVASFEADRLAGDGDIEVNSQFTLIALDRTQMPTISLDYESFGSDFYGQIDPVFSLDFDRAHIYPMYSSNVISAGPSIKSTDVGKTLYFPASNFTISGLAADSSSNSEYPNISDFGIPFSSLDGVNMNDLVIFPVWGGGFGSNVRARIALRFLCPVDKAPGGMSVGDRWPKVYPVKVEIDDALQPFYDAMLEWSQTPTPEDIDDMMGDLQGFGLDSLDLLEFDDDQASFVSSAFILAQPLVVGLFPIIFFGIIALILANKAMH